MGKVFMVGDFETNTGPAIANKALKDGLGEKACYNRKKTKIGRVVELFVGTIVSETICFCGFSELNTFGVKLAKLFGKRSVYLMHGYIEVEAKINNVYLRPKRIRSERYLLRNVDKIICVSELLAKKLKEISLRENSVYVVHNIVEPVQKGRTEKDPLLVMSTGGGMPRKNNIAVCKAIEQLNFELAKDKQIRYLITGGSYGFEDEFSKFSFVEYLGDVSHGECLDLMSNCKVYIQNSIFETFGLAVIEAAGQGCNLLLSRHIGALDVIKNYKKEQIINDVDNLEEIKQKLFVQLFGDENNNVSVDWGAISEKHVIGEMIKIMDGEK